VDGYEARTYGDAFADVYDEWYAEVGDVAAAVDALVELAGGRPVLELGVGSGRLAVPLAARDVAVWGLDASTAMLDRLGARPGGAAVHAVHGDMADPAASLPDGVRFGAVVAAFNTFFLLASEAAQQACLRASAALLADGGAVVVECYVPAEPPAGVERVLEPRRIGLDHVVLTATEHDPATQRVVGQHIELRPDGTRLRPWVLRYATPEQLDAMAAGAGLRLRGRWSGWGGEPFGDADPMHVSVYEAG
jgi:SAM-dependent methyltransferase